MNEKLKVKDKVYYARIIPQSSIFDVCDLIVRTVEDEWFVGIEKRSEHALLFYEKDIGNTIFLKRKDALDKVKIAESKMKINPNEEIYYEEY